MNGREDGGPNKTMSKAFDCIVIGGGPAGMLSAGAAAGKGVRTALVERNDGVGKKLQMTGGGRCNIGNLIPPREFMAAFGREGQFLRPALEAFGAEQMERLLGEVGVRLRREGAMLFVQGGGRALVAGLKEFLLRRGVAVFCGQRVVKIEGACEGGFHLTTEGESFVATNKVVIAAGGKSYPSTGSAGDGFSLAAQLGHTVTRPIPAMGAIRLVEDFFGGLAGISVPQVTVEVLADGKRAGTFSGSLLITHGGVSGPAVLDASLVIARSMQKGRKTSIKIDFVSGGEGDEMLALEMLPHRLLETFLRRAGVDVAAREIQITRSQRQRLCEILRGLTLAVADTGSWEQGMVTVGGVALKEVEPRTMASRITAGVHFAGEVLDLAASCGGYNIQAAMATGYLAGISPTLTPWSH